MTTKENQSFSTSNHDIPHAENIGQFETSPNRVQTAALWLSQHRDELTGPVFPVLKERFGLCNLEAIEAAKQAHALAYSGA